MDVDDKIPKMLHCLKCSAFIVGEKEKKTISVYNFQIKYATVTKEHITL